MGLPGAQLKLLKTMLTAPLSDGPTDRPSESMIDQIYVLWAGACAHSKPLEIVTISIFRTQPSEADGGVTVGGAGPRAEVLALREERRAAVRAQVGTLPIVPTRFLGYTYR